jgi:hypothetical protein
MDLWITDIADLPLHLFYTREKGNVEAWRNTLMYAYGRLNVRYVVIDHIHAAVSSGNDERIQLENMAKMYADVAVDTGMHLIVVAHPHQLPAPKGKDRDNVIVQLGDVKGTSALKQYADNVLSVWRGRRAARDKVVNVDGYGTTIVYLLKVRDEDGQEGRVPFRYDVDAALMLDDSPQQLFTNKPSVKEHWTDGY